MNWLTRLIVNTLAVFGGAYLLPGVHVKNFTTAILVAIVLGFLNVVLKPVLVILTIPITIVTLGFFLLVINALIVLLCTEIVPGFSVDGFWYALLYSVVISLIVALLDNMAGKKKELD